MMTPFEFGAAIWKKTDGSYVASDAVTEGRPDRIRLGVSSFEGHTFVRTIHTHLPKGVYGFTDKDGKQPTDAKFTATNPTEPSAGDYANARNSGVAGYVLVPSEQLLVGYDRTGNRTVLLSEDDYKEWMRRAQQERVQANERAKQQEKKP